jgi:hypothetical protein|tara:strand:+ start:176 stop:535 length:360 start_codon:yes stop_codon:yes gene_type:complete
MAHFAKIGLNNKVTNVISIHDNVLKDADGVEQEVLGVQYLEGTTGWSLWKQTSYNANLRKNFAGIGYTYDEDRDAFIPPKPFNSWVLNETTCVYNAPVAKPDDGNEYYWNENIVNWEQA